MRCTDRPATRYVHCGVEIEDVHKVVETDHLLVQIVQLNAALKVGQCEHFRWLKTKTPEKVETLHHSCDRGTNV